MNRSNFILLIIFFVFILPGSQGPPVTSDEQYHKLALFRSHLYHNYHSLQNAAYDENVANITGFMLSYEDVLHGEVNQTYPIDGKDYDHWRNNQEYSILPNDVIQQAQYVWSLEADNDSSERNFYPNISSSLKGEFLKKNETTYELIPLQLPPYLEHFYEDLHTPSADTTKTDPSNVVGNITIPTGLISVDIGVVETIDRSYFNRLDSQIKLINVEFDLRDDDESNRHTVETKGFYFVESGNIITMTNSAKFMSMYGGIQHLTMYEGNFDLSKNLTLEYLEHTFFRRSETENVDISFNYLQQIFERSTRHCEYVSYFHLNTVNLTKQELTDLDKELTSPIGRPIDYAAVPHLNLTGFLYSPDCGIEISVPSVTGVRREVTMYNYHRAVTGGILLLLAQILLTVKQMNHTNTPSTISRISFWSICLISLVDGSLSMIYLVSSAVWNSLYMPLTVSAFLSFILASLFEMRFMISIYMSQINERTLNLFTALQGRPIDDADDDGSQRQGPPQTAQDTVPQPTVDPQDESQVSSIIYSRFFFVLIIFTFAMVNSITWPKHVRTTFEYTVLFVLNSYWLPQVYRNAVRGSHRSFKWWFIIGTTTVRTLPLFYIFVVKGNVFDHHKDTHFFLVLVFWLLLQLSLLVLQSVFGARFFLPKRLLPQTYNYHPALTEQDLETGFGVDHFDPGEQTPLQHGGDLESTTSIKHENGRCIVDCAICMNTVEVPILRSNLDQAATFLQRRNYMMTPCRHIFHTQCLEAWMKYKLQCPVCRNSLPPL